MISNKEHQVSEISLAATQGDPSISGSMVKAKYLSRSILGRPVMLCMFALLAASPAEARGWFSLSSCFIRDCGCYRLPLCPCRHMVAAQEAASDPSEDSEAAESIPEVKRPTFFDERLAYLRKHDRSCLIKQSCKDRSCSWNQLCEQCLDDVEDQLPKIVNNLPDGHAKDIAIYFQYLRYQLDDSKNKEAEDPLVAAVNRAISRMRSKKIKKPMFFQSLEERLAYLKKYGLELGACQSGSRSCMWFGLCHQCFKHVEPQLKRIVKKIPPTDATLQGIVRYFDYLKDERPDDHRHNQRDRLDFLIEAVYNCIKKKQERRRLAEPILLQRLIRDTNRKP